MVKMLKRNTAESHKTLQEASSQWDESKGWQCRALTSWARMTVPSLLGEGKVFFVYPRLCCGFSFLFIKAKIKCSRFIILWLREQVRMQDPVSLNSGESLLLGKLQGGDFDVHCSPSSESVSNQLMMMLLCLFAYLFIIWIGSDGMFSMITSCL